MAVGRHLNPVGSAAAAGPDTDRLDALFAAAADNVAAHQVVESMTEHLGAGLATLINLFNPQRMVLTGSVGLRLTSAMLDMIRGRAGRYSLRQPFESVDIVQGQLGHDAPVTPKTETRSPARQSTLGETSMRARTPRV